MFILYVHAKKINTQLIFKTTFIIVYIDLHSFTLDYIFLLLL
jgi:hypothetical protein